MEGLELAEACRELAANKKAEDVLVLDVREVSGITDYFVIATGSSEPHVRAIWTEITKGLSRQHQVNTPKPEGTRFNSWVVVDLFDVIVHVMSRDVRERYDLEGLWNDAHVVEPARVAE